MTVHGKSSANYVAVSVTFYVAIYAPKFFIVNASVFPVFLRINSNVKLVSRKRTLAAK